MTGSVNLDISEFKSGRRGGHEAFGFDKEIEHEEALKELVGGVVARREGGRRSLGCVR